MKKPYATIIDVLANFDGGNGVSSDRALSMSIPEIDELAELVNQHYSAWTPLIEPDVLTVHPGFMAGRGLNADQTPKTEDLFSVLLYYPRVVIHDPLSDWFNTDKARLTIKEGPRLKGNQWWMDSSEISNGMQPYSISRGDLDESRAALRNMLRTLEVLKPLIIEGAVLPVPQWQIVKRYEQKIITAVRHDINDTHLFELIDGSSNPFTVQDLGIQLGKMQMSNAPANLNRRLAIEAPSFYFNKTIAIASEMGAVYVPPFGTDYSLWRFKIDKVAEQMRMRSGREPQIIRDLMKISLPVFGKVSADDLVKIRKNEDAFADFRSLLDREFALGFATEDPLFPVSVALQVQDSLQKQMEEVRKACASSSVLKLGISGLPKHLAIAGASALALQLSGPGVTATTAVTAGATGLVSAIYDMVFRPRLSGAKLVLSGLLD